MVLTLFTPTNPSTWFFLPFALYALAREPAWSGKTPPGSDKPKAFLPFYVPPGSKSYDSSSPLIQYRGPWSQSYSSSYIEGTSRWTDEPGARASLPFVGTGVEWFGSQDRTHGIATIFIDGQEVDVIDAWSHIPRTQQRLFWKYDLPYGKHLIEIEHTGRGAEGVAGPITDIDAMVITRGHDYGPVLPIPAGQDDAQSYDEGQWSLIQRGSTGIAAMQLAIISPSHALIIDKVEHNPISIDGHPAWGALYNLDTHAVMPLKIQSNSFCAGGTFLSNGTLINVGGNPVIENFTSAADFGHLDGLQAVRLFHPCLTRDISRCHMYEDHTRIRMASPRWYNTVVRLSDGSAMVIGGSKKGGWINNATVNNPTVEYWPPKSIHGSNGLPIYLPFLVDTLNANLFPIAFTLPDGKVFMAANQGAMIYDWMANREQRLPRIPNGVRVTYPMAGVGLLLPLSPRNNYTPEILICGGSAINDTSPGYEISSQDSASTQCSRITLTEAGIAAGWKVEFLPEPRHMPDAVLLPTGHVFIVNGARSGISGYGNVKGRIGESNADNPNFTPVLYTPDAPPGRRFSTVGMKSSPIPRMYHSVATLTPAADVLVAGSNPNLDRSEMKYGTEYRVERFQPPYMNAERPVIAGLPHNVYYAQPFEMYVSIPLRMNTTGPITVALMDLGFVTHATHANSRLVYLTVLSLHNGENMVVSGPPDGNIYPPGPGWIFLVVNGVPSQGKMVMIGDGQDPPLNEAAWENMLMQTTVDQYEESKKKGKAHDKTAE